MSASGARVTDVVEWFTRRGESKTALNIIQARTPERFRWKMAAATLTAQTGRLTGKDRMRVEEPMRELVLDISDPFLQREVVLDARRAGVDLDRGEILPHRTLLDVRRLAFLVGTDLRVVQKHLLLPDYHDATIDTGAVALIGRAYAEAHRKRAQKLWLEIPDSDGPEPIRLHHQYMADRAKHDIDLARRWTAFSRAVLDTGREE